MNIENKVSEILCDMIDFSLELKNEDMVKHKKFGKIVKKMCDLEEMIAKQGDDVK